MTNAKIDDNWNPTLIGVRASDGATPERAEIDHITGRLLTDATVSGTISIDQPDTSAVTRVNDTATSTTLKAANTSRKEIKITNTSTAILYILEGSDTASASNWTDFLEQNDRYSSDYTGQINGVWASDPNTGVAVVVEST